MTPQPLLLINACVFDGEAQLSDPQSVRIDNGRVAAIGPSLPELPEALPGCETIDLRGRTLMPGLIDAHTHVWLCDLDLALATDRRDPYIAAFAFQTLGRMLDRGFTTVRDAGGAEIGYALALEQGLARGPRLLHAGCFISQTGGHFDVRKADSFSFGCGCAHLSGFARFAAIVDGADEVRRAVREELRKGAKQIKLMASGGVASPTDPLDRMQFSDAEILAAVEEAERHGTYVMAHCHPASAIERCAVLGVRSIEHGSLMSHQAADAVATAGAYVVPTMATVWALTENGPRQGLPPENQLKATELAKGVLAGLQIMREHGLKIGFGTDLMGPQQDRQATEFKLRSQVFSPLEILRAATSVNAGLLRMEDRIGRVAVGFDADLIVVDGDPLQDLGLLSDPNGGPVPLVIQGGRVVKRTGALAHA